MCISWTADIFYFKYLQRIHCSHIVAFKNLACATGTKQSAYCSKMGIGDFSVSR